MRADPVLLRQRALAATPPVEAGDKLPSDLVEVTRLAPGIKLDIRYAGLNNFMGIPLYETPAAYLQRPAAEALARIHRALAAQGYGLLIHDAYRPWSVTWMFWEATPPEARIFVADPAEGSRHNRGCAVDLTLYDLKTGRPVEMPSRYDEFSTRAYADFVGGTTKQRALRAILRGAMEADGFTVYAERRILEALHGPEVAAAHDCVGVFVWESAAAADGKDRFVGEVARRGAQALHQPMPRRGASAAV